MGIPTKLTTEEEGSEVLFARHSIYSKNMDVEYYELLFRSSDPNKLKQIDDDKATYDVIVNNYANAVQNDEHQPIPCFLKVTDGVLLKGDLPELPRGRFVLELLGRSNISDELITRLKELSAQGVRLALADYDPTDRRFDPLLNIVHILKLDIQKLGLEKMPLLLQKLRPFQLELLADKVESKDEYVKCIDMGFALYQGFFLSEPSTVKGKKIGANKSILLELMQEIDRQGADAKTLEEIALNDPSLTFKILKVVNSAAFSTPKEIQSLSHAITLLGMSQIKRWIVIFLVGGEERVPPDLMNQMLVRGRMCELLAEMSGLRDPIGCFMVGILSQLDSLLNIEMQDLLAQMPLSAEVSSAILNHSGEMGLILSDVKYYQHGEFDSIKGKLGNSIYQVSYRHSLNWASQVMKAM